MSFITHTEGESQRLNIVLLWFSEVTLDLVKVWDELTNLPKSSLPILPIPG